MRRTRAIVVGGSIAGLCAARALVDLFDDVVLLERDAYAAGAGERAGVPQARHVHALLTRGWIELEQLFPGFQARMRAAGVQEIDAGVDMATLRPAGWQARVPVGYRLYFMTRDRTEAILRALLRQTRVEVRERMEVTGLLAAPRFASGPPRHGQARARVTGVVARSRDGGGTLEISADLVVDASGRGSRAPHWLSALGARAPAESVVDSFAAYSSRWFRRPHGDRWPRRWWWRGVWIDVDPPRRLLGGVLFPVEDGRWIATLIGFSRAYPPADAEGFTRALDTLRSPALARAVALGEPISPVYSSRAMSNRFRHYERLEDRIEGFAATGDSVCVFNPIYGQGMTVAALSAWTLAEQVRRLGPRHPDLGRAFFAAQARVLRAPWDLAVGADLRFPATEGVRPPAAAILKGYTDALFAACIDDEAVQRRAMEVFYLLKPGYHLFAPGLVSRVFAGAIRARLRRATHVAAIPPMPPDAGCRTSLGHAG